MIFSRNRHLGQSAQVTVEYVFLLSLVIGMFIMVERTLFRPVVARLKDRVLSGFSETLFNRGDLHQLKIGH